jgi:glycerol-3-phosphate dehydrogenase
MGPDLKACRRPLWEAAAADFDVAVIGGGVSGACLFHRLGALGYRTLLVDRGDFAGATSQASAMMIWGGLLYLKQLDIGAVWRFSRSRERMIRRRDGRVAVRRLRYLPERSDPWRLLLLRMGLYLYWVLGQGRRRLPALERRFPEERLLGCGTDRAALAYEEAFLPDSDARFVLSRITARQPPGALALNYCALGSATWSPRERRFRLELEDTLNDERAAASARLVVNCAGVWTDRIHDALGIRAPWRHRLSKGVFLAFERPPEHRDTLIADMGRNGDVLALIPWGPVSLWGPTETEVDSIAEGFRATAADAAFLLERAEALFPGVFGKERLVALRGGIRPLAVPRGWSRKAYPLSISRRHRIWKDPERPWVAAWGGKITGAEEMAAALARRVAEALPPPRPSPRPKPGPPPAPLSSERVTFPGIAAKLPSPAWCRAHELCWTLEDYLRRRTNIAQWVPREGLGRRNETLPAVESLALSLCGGDAVEARRLTARHLETVGERHDALLDRL